jgi:hypothetical protein
VSDRQYSETERDTSDQITSTGEGEERGDETYARGDAGRRALDAD